MSMTAELHLVDLLKDARVDAPNSSFVSLQPITIDRDTRMSIFQHPDSTAAFEIPDLGKNAVLKTAIGMKDVCWNKVRSPVIFRVVVIDRQKKHELLFHALDARNAEGRRWHDVTLSLAKFRGRPVTILLSTSVPPSADASYAWSGWADPVIHFENKRKAVQRSRNSQSKSNVLVISSDALRADYLQCYGHPIVKTPHIDQLLADGVQFSHARAATPTTLGSYASMFTGKHATKHRVIAEWGKLESTHQTLASIFAQNGYQTVSAVSEAELADQETGLGKGFDTVIKCLANPAQSGDIAARQFNSWLDARSCQSAPPFFAWVQFFDTHPPASPPEPFRSLYYQGRPDDPLRSYWPDRVMQIRGMESVLELEPAVSLLRKGVADRIILERLKATADALSGRSKVSPDLAVNIKSLGERAFNGTSIEQFSIWLDAQVESLKSGADVPELADWIEFVLPLLKEIENDTLSWLDGVLDFRYPIAQYMGSISYVDAQIGEIIQKLKGLEIYDDTLILFTAPHGELLGELDVCFHHHALAEEVLRVPALIKPSRHKPFTKGARIGGVFDQVDILPTLLESADLPLPDHLDGESRWAEVQNGAAIADHDSFAVNYHFTMFSLTRPPYTYLFSADANSLSSKWVFKDSEEMLLALVSPMSYERNLIHEMPEVAEPMRKRLRELSRVHKLLPM